MNKYTLIGHPLGHSMSPFIHNRLFEISGREADYTCTDIAPAELSAKYKELNTLSGYNVTIPHKVSIISFLDKLDDSAKRYGAVNCVANTKGTIIGYNTDCDGFLRSLESFPLSEKVLLLGCGGVGRMMAIEAVLHGATLTIAIIEKDLQTAQTLLSEILNISPNAKVNIVMINEISGKYNLLINATPVGMYPNTNDCPVSDDVIANCDTVFDAIYNPVKTKLILTAESMGKKTQGGMAMLVLQAVKAHEIWDNDLYSTKDIENIIAEANAIVERDFQ